jgi:CBS domain-containing protein
MRVHEIIQRKGSAVYQILPSASLADVVDRLVEYKCGSLLVTEGETVFGIITERDILKTINRERKHLGTLLVRDFMTSDLVTGQSSDDVQSLMGKMTKHRLRHLPIIDDGKLAGMISIGDVVKAQFDSISSENHQLMSYIKGHVT